MKTVKELTSELEMAMEQEKVAKQAWLATRVDYEFNFKNDEYKAFREAKDKVEALKDQIKVAERFEVKVGDGVTYHLYSDSQACTVIKRTAKSITIQEDTAILDPSFKPEFIQGGFAGHCINQNEQKYTYEANPKGAIITARWSDKYGAFMYCDKRITNGRHQFYDYNF